MSFRRSHRLPPSVAFEPIEVGDDFYSGVAYELNRNAEGIDLVQPPDARPAVVEYAAAGRAGRMCVELDLPEVLCGAMDEDVADWERATNRVLRLSPTPQRRRSSREPRVASVAFYTRVRRPFDVPNAPADAVREDVGGLYRAGLLSR